MAAPAKKAEKNSKKVVAKKASTPAKKSVSKPAAKKEVKKEVKKAVKPAANKTVAKKTAAKPATKAVAKKAEVKKTAAKKPVTKAPVKKTATKPAVKPAAKKTAAKPVAKKAVAKKPVAKASAAKKPAAGNYLFLGILLGAMVLGCLTGWLAPESARTLAPVGKIFINMMFCIVVPLVFASVSGSVAGMKSRKRAGKVLGTTIAVFIVTGTIAAATRRNADDEMSPGSVPRNGLRESSDVKGCMSVTGPSSSILAPIARSMRVVWSRTGPGTRNLLSPSAPSAASWRQLNTCAEATGRA